ncbi:Hypothetical protein D9617_2g056470 [Elsinoe fawcettii]|nr:Hypothetical protein D9617_2g056470 [Elsinoe fawcettii]
MPKTGDQETPWTASRCLRLLRPITSRIEPLEKLVAASTRNANANSDSGDKNSLGEDSNDSSFKSPSYQRDPSWVPRGPGAIRRTYAGRFRARHNVHHTVQQRRIDEDSMPAAPMLPTPYREAPRIQPFDTREDENELSDSVADEDGIARGSHPRMNLHGIRWEVLRTAVSTPKTQKSANLEEGILEGLITVLERTKNSIDQTATQGSSDVGSDVAGQGSAGDILPNELAPHQQAQRSFPGGFPGSISSGGPQIANYARKKSMKSVSRLTAQSGPSSLFDTCLHQVPTLIDFEQAQVEADGDNDDVNIADEIYTDLESLGTADSSYPPLRKVVRAHAIHLVANGFRTGLFKSDTWAILYAELLSRAQRSEVLDFLAVGISIKGLKPTVTKIIDDSAQSLPNSDEMTPASVICQYFHRDEVVDITCFSDDSWRSWIVSVCGSLAREACGESLVAIEHLLSICGVPEMREDGSTGWDLCNNSGTHGSAIRKIAGNIDFLLTVLASMAMVGLKTSQDDPKMVTAISITTVFKTSTMRILSELQQHVYISGGAGSDAGWKALATKLLILTTVLQLTALNVTDKHSIFDAEIMVMAMRKVWFPKQDWRADKARKQHAIDALHSVALCIGSGDSERSADALHDSVRPLMDAAYGCGEVAATFLRELCVETTRQFAKSDRRPKSRRIARDIEEECEALGEAFEKTAIESLQLSDVTGEYRRWAFDEDLREWIVFTPVKAKDSSALKRPSPEPDHDQQRKTRKTVIGIDDSGYASGLLSSATPIRSYNPVPLPSSPDELGPGWTPARLSLPATVEHMQGELAAAPHPTWSSSPVAGSISQTASAAPTNDGEDELAMSVRRSAPRSLRHAPRVSRSEASLVVHSPDDDEIDELS